MPELWAPTPISRGEICLSRARVTSKPADDKPVNNPADSPTTQAALRYAPGDDKPRARRNSSETRKTVTFGKAIVRSFEYEREPKLQVRAKRNRLMHRLDTAIAKCRREEAHTLLSQILELQHRLPPPVEPEPGLEEVTCTCNDYESPCGCRG